MHSILARGPVVRTWLALLLFDADPLLPSCFGELLGPRGGARRLLLPIYALSLALAGETLHHLIAQCVWRARGQGGTRQEQGKKKTSNEAGSHIFRNQFLSTFDHMFLVLARSLERFKGPRRHVLFFCPSVRVGGWPGTPGGLG